MSGDRDAPAEPEPTLEPATDLLEGAPETAYFWGHVAGAGEVRENGFTVTTSDETAARRLATIAAADVVDLERETAAREYAHDASVMRTDDEYTLAIEAEDGRLFGRSCALGFPVDARGTSRFDAVRSHERDLLRGLLESCGTVCFKSSSGTVGVSFVHDDRGLLEAIQRLLADCPIDAPTGEIAETSSGGFWFGLADEAVPAFGSWLYAGCEETGLFAPKRRRKLRRSLEEAESHGFEGSDDGDGTDGE